MNQGGHMFGTVSKILRFNGGLFASPQALRLNKKALTLLLQAAECDWSGVEPAIFIGDSASHRFQGEMA